MRSTKTFWFELYLLFPYACVYLYCHKLNDSRWRSWKKIIYRKRNNAQYLLSFFVQWVKAMALPDWWLTGVIGGIDDERWRRIISIKLRSLWSCMMCASCFNSCVVTYISPTSQMAMAVILPPLRVHAQTCEFQQLDELFQTKIQIITEGRFWSNYRNAQRAVKC